MITFSDIPVAKHISCLGLTKRKLLVFAFKDIYIPTKVAICYIVTLDIMAVQLEYLLYMKKTDKSSLLPAIDGI